MYFAHVFPDRQRFERELARTPEVAFLRADCALLEGRRGELAVLTSAPSSGCPGARTFGPEASWEELQARLSQSFQGSSPRRLPSPWMALRPRPGPGGEPERLLVDLPDPEAYEALVRSSLEFRPKELKALRTPEGRSLLLARGLSTFLRLGLEADPRVRLFYEGETRGLFLPWGTTHPLGDRFVGLDRGGDWILLDAAGQFQRIPEEPFQDVLESLVLDWSEIPRESWSRKEELPKLTIQVRLGHRPEPREAEVWMLAEEALSHLEAFAARTSEEDLRSLQIAGCRDEEQVFFLVRASGDLRRSLEALGIPGTSFASYGGFGNFFLPVDRLLRPPVRPDRFRTLFELRAGSLVFLLPEGEAGFRRLEVPEPGFRPFFELVDYYVQRETLAWSDALEVSTFDLAPLEFLPEREPTRVAGVGPSPLPRSPKKAEDLEAGGQEAEAGSLETRQRLWSAKPEAMGGDELLPPDPAPVPVPPEGPASPEPQALSLSAADQALAQLETEVLKEPSADSWFHLAELRRARSEREDARFAYVESLWLEPKGQSQSQYEALLLETSEDLPTRPHERAEALLARLETGLPDPEIRQDQTLALAHALRGIEEAGLRTRLIQGIYPRLRELSLRPKERWLAWEAVLSTNGDSLEEERQREEILSAMSRQGLDPRERPRFLGRYLRSLTQEGDLRMEAEIPEILEALEAAARSLPPGPESEESVALVLRSRIEADREGSQESFLELERLAQSASSDAGVETMCHFLGACGALRPQALEGVFEEIRTRLGSQRRIPARTLMRLIENLIFVDGFHGAQALVPGLFSLLAGLPPANLGLDFAKLGPLLADLGASEELRNLTRELLAKDEIIQDLFHVDQVSDPLRRGIAEVRLEAEDYQRLAAALEESPERYGCLYLHLLEETVVASGAPFLSRLIETAPRVIRRAREAVSTELRDLIHGCLEVRLEIEAGRGRLCHEKVEVLIQGLEGLDRSSLLLGMTWICRTLAVLGDPIFGARHLEGIAGRALSDSGRESLEPYQRADVLIEVALVAGELALAPFMVELLQRFLGLVEQELEGERKESDSYLFRALTSGIQGLARLGEWKAGAEVARRVGAVVEKRVRESEGVQRGPWFYLHEARVVCACTRIEMGYEEEGRRALEAWLEDLDRVSVNDRFELLEKASSVLSFLDGNPRRDFVAAFSEWIQKTKDCGVYDRMRRRDLLVAMAESIRPGAEAYRREQRRWDALASKDLRRRLISSRPASQKG